MKIIDRLNEDRINISFEVFPPKTDAGFANVQRATDEIAKLDPSYISVTYGAGGGTSKNTAKIASHIKDDLHVLSLAHLTCASSTKEEVREVIRNLKELGIENILALRGDIPEGMKFPDGDRFHYAYELVEEIRKQGDFCIGAACYPEGHVENEHKEDDIRFLKQKVTAVLISLQRRCSSTMISIIISFTGSGKPGSQSRFSRESCRSQVRLR